ncbi:hypothetical protein B5G34_06790 [Flavonifractor sp. An82]|nr:hypothetical protein B5G34_06790 [Flavonifractor sp. An82]
MAFSWAAGGASAPAGQAPPGTPFLFICSGQINCPGIKVLPIGQNAWTRTLFLPPPKMGRADISPALVHSLSLPRPASPWRPRWPSPGRREERPRSGQSGR